MSSVPTQGIEEIKDDLLLVATQPGSVLAFKGADHLCSLTW